MSKKLLLNPIRRKVILEAFHKSVHELPKRPEYKIAVDNVYEFLLPFITIKYPQNDMLILAKYNTAFTLGTLVYQNRTSFSLNITVSKSSRTVNAPIRYDLNGLLFPYHYIEMNSPIVYRYNNSVNDPRLKESYTDNGVRIQSSFPFIELPSDMIEKFHLLHGLACREINFPDDVYYKYSKLVYASRTFDELTDINPSFEKFREIAEKAQINKIKRAPTQTKCILNEDQVKVLIDEPFNF